MTPAESDSVGTFPNLTDAESRLRGMWTIGCSLPRGAFVVHRRWHPRTRSLSARERRCRFEIQDRAVPTTVYGGIFLCSLAVLMEEVLLTRIFSFTIWYHLAYLTISTALLGFRAAGSMLTIFPRLWQSAPRRVAGGCTVGAGIAVLISMAILAPRPIEPGFLLTRPRSFFIDLLGYYIVVTIPFLLAGLGIAIPLAAYPRRINRLYCADLVGAGLGCLVAVVALNKLDAAGATTVCAAIFLAAGVLYSARQSQKASFLAVVAMAVAGGTPFAGEVVDFVPTQSKQLARTLRSPLARSSLHSMEPC